MVQLEKTEKAGEHKPPALRILIVDDNVDASVTLALFLEQMGYPVVVAHHPYEALSKTQNNSFDFFLLDIGLPDMDGYELMQSLQGLTKNRRVTFAAYTAYGDDSYKKKSLAVGFTHHFVKPGDVDEFLAAFEAALNYSYSNECKK